MPAYLRPAPRNSLSLPFFSIFLLTYCYFSVTNHLVVEGVTSLHAVDYFTLLVIAHSWYHSDCLMEIYIEILVCSLNLLHAETFECLDELVENHLYTFLDSLRIFALVGKCALKVVEDRKDGREY